MGKLAPCRKCGGDAEIIYSMERYIGRCKKCLANTGGYGTDTRSHAEARALAEDSWNRNMRKDENDAD